jgi:hypothetical protein
MSADPVLDWATVGCSASLDDANTTLPASADFMNKRCAKTFCHGSKFVASLDLRPDSGFAKRTKDVISKHESIPCLDDVTRDCVPSSCPPPGSVTLIDSSDPASSWMLATANQDPRVGGTYGCGDNMPPTSGLATTNDRECLAAIVNAVAALPVK